NYRSLELPGRSDELPSIPCRIEGLATGPADSCRGQRFRRRYKAVLGGFFIKVHKHRTRGNLKFSECRVVKCNATGISQSSRQLDTLVQSRRYIQREVGLNGCLRDLASGRNDNRRYG